MQSKKTLRVTVIRTDANSKEGEELLRLFDDFTDRITGRSRSICKQSGSRSGEITSKKLTARRLK